MLLRIFCIFITILFFVFPVNATTYYIDYDSGNDSNTGTSKSSPWKHAPGMQGCSGNCASYETTHSDSSNRDGAGNQFIFKGGVTWPNSVLAWDWNLGGGTEENPIYFGVDKSWYAGDSWSRPIIDAQSLPITPDPVTGSSAMFRVYYGGDGYFIVDNLEFKGLKQFGNSDSGIVMLNMQCENFEVKNCYFHGWSRDANATEEKVVCLYSNLISSPDMDSSIHHNVWDGSDTTKDMAKAYKGSAGYFYNNYIAHVYNGLIACTVYVYGNTFKDIGTTFDPNGHGNVVENTGGQLIAFNNYIEYSHGGATIYHTPVDGKIDYDFNNLIIDERNQAIQVGSTELVNGTGSGIYIFNNTIQSPEGVSSKPINGPSKVGDAKLPFMEVRNNHLIADNPSVNFGTEVEIEIESNTLGQTNAQATSAGYLNTNVYPYYPPSNGGTVDTGYNCLSICDSIPDDTAKQCCKQDSPIGILYDPVDHTVISYRRDSVVRPQGSAWDIGAYEYVWGNFLGISFSGGISTQ